MIAKQFYNATFTYVIISLNTSSDFSTNTCLLHSFAESWMTDKRIQTEVQIIAVTTPRGDRGRGIVSGKFRSDGTNHVRQMEKPLKVNLQSSG